MNALIPVCHGNAWSVCLRDPEDNCIELFVDADRYIHQPIREPLDLDPPGFKPIEDWRTETVRKTAEH